jgi:BirA family biotin operon repressor/biotin-[acetyl-CoA-carboxylase] ligase
MQITAHTPTVLGVEIEMLSTPLDSSIINAAVTQYWRVSVVELTASTQSDVVALVQKGKAQSGDVVAAEFQSEGRGRLSRSFDAPQSTALLFSFYVQPKRSREDWGWLPLIAGVSVAQTLSKYGARVKWPNDILIKDKKVSGLIAEVVGEGVVIGIGINVGMAASELPVPTATSLLIEGAANLTRNQLLADLLNTFERNFAPWDRGENEIADVYLSLSATVGTQVRVEYPDGSTEIALAVAISPNGELVLDSGAHVQAGDIVHLR